MTSAPASPDAATEASGVAAVPMRFEVTTLPVADVDRAKAFYQRLGWRLDIDFNPTQHTRGVQFTPPGSPASIQFGQGITTMTPGSLDGLLLVVEDIAIVAAGVVVGAAGVALEFFLGRAALHGIGSLFG